MTISKELSAKDGLRFDWYVLLKADFMDDLVNEILDQIEQTQTSTRGISKEKAKCKKQQQRVIAQHLLSALYSAYSAISNKKTPTRVSVVKKTNGYSEDKAKFPNRIHYSRRYFMHVYYALEQLKWISVDEGELGKGYTRIYAKNRLKVTFEKVGLRWLPQVLKASVDLIVLRDKVEIKPTTPRHTKAPKKYKKITLATPDTPEVAAMADSLYSINQFLTEHCFALNVPDKDLYEIAKALAGSKEDVDSEEEKHTSIDFSRVQLRRIFSQNSLTKGGRFYNGWWQAIPSIYRQHITIDGYKTSEVDYSNMSLRLVYGLAGIDLDPNRDLYNIGLDNWKGKDDPRRQVIKQYINALMNHYTGNYKLKAHQRKALGLSNDEIKALVKTHHAPIFDKLTSSIGSDLQFLDSQIAELVIKNMMKDDIVVLPIHDSFIVRTGYESWLKKVMEAASKEILGALVPVESDGSRLPKHFGLDKEQFKKELKAHNESPISGIVKPNELDFETIFNKTLMKDYQRHWGLWKAKNS